MSPVYSGKITSLSVSEAESFDHAQKGGCGLKWYFERVLRLRPEQDDAQTEGDLGHALLATYLRTGQAPKGRVKMGTVVTRAIASGHLPELGPDLRVEERGSGQPQRDANGKWIKLDTTKTLWLGGAPWDLFIDLRFKRDGVVTVWDHKFSSDPRLYAKKSDELIKTIQLPVYCLDSLRVWPDAEQFRIVHYNIARTGDDSFTREALVTLDEVRERETHIEKTVNEMRQVATAKESEIPYNLKACDAWNGCPHQARCPRFKNRSEPMLTPEELALFGDSTPAPAPAVTSPTPTPAPAVAAVIPPDAPPNDAKLPPPEKGKKKQRAVLDVKEGETVEQAVEREAISQQPIVRGPEIAESMKPRPQAANAVQIPDSISADQLEAQLRSRLAEISTPAAATAVFHVYELGPETLAFLKALLSK